MHMRKSKYSSDGITRFQGALLFDASTQPVITTGAIINHYLVGRDRRLLVGMAVTLNRDALS